MKTLAISIFLGGAVLNAYAIPSQLPVQSAGGVKQLEGFRVPALVGATANKTGEVKDWKTGIFGTRSGRINIKILQKNKQRVLVTQKSDGAGKPLKVVDAVRLPGVAKPLQMIDVGMGCHGPGWRKDSGSKEMLVEVLYEHCEMRSSNILSAWIIDNETGSISPTSGDGIECKNFHLNAGDRFDCDYRKVRP